MKAPNAVLPIPAIATGLMLPEYSREPPPPGVSGVSAIGEPEAIVFPPGEIPSWAKFSCCSVLSLLERHSHLVRLFACWLLRNSECLGYSLVQFLLMAAPSVHAFTESFPRLADAVGATRLSVEQAGPGMLSAANPANHLALRFTSTRSTMQVDGGRLALVFSGVGRQPRSTGSPSCYGGSHR